SGVLEFWSSGVLEFWSSGVLEVCIGPQRSYLHQFRSFGLLSDPIVTIRSKTPDIHPIYAE
ncbi:hypothetical protein, partial [Paenibacillus odorifer]|uniref:hypothetical protein n=1 Tax=Paenibacillus odorifer TaxID=189426 RepID=UPI0020C0CD40